MKNLTFLLCAFSFFALNAQDTYYINPSHVNASDSHVGTSQSAPWSSLENLDNNDIFDPGDVIKLARGEVFTNQSFTFRSSGNSSSPIIIEAYGTGDKPVVSSVSEIDFSDYTWTHQGDGVWKTANNEFPVDPGRLFIDYDASDATSSKELIKAYSAGSSTIGNGNIGNLGEPNYSGIDGGPLNSGTIEFPRDKWYWHPTEKSLYFHTGNTGSNPSLTVTNPVYKSTTEDDDLAPVRFYGESYITIRDIEVHGGTSAIIIAETVAGVPSDHFVIKNCSIGRYSTTGIHIHNVDYIDIYNNEFDSNYTVEFGLSEDDADDVYTNDARVNGSDRRGNGDAININDGGTYIDIYDNIFTNWAHGAISMSSPDVGDEVVSNNRVFNNYISAPDISYSRAFVVSGSDNLVKDNEIYNNLVEFTRVQNQIAGNDNDFHHNIIYDVAQSDVRPPGSANGLIIAANSENYAATGNNIDHNTFINCDDAGISVNNWGNTNWTIQPLVNNNNFRNNIIYNCGRQVNSFNDYLGLIIADDDHGVVSVVDTTIKNNTYENNLIYSFNSSGVQQTTVVHYHQSDYTVSNFESQVVTDYSTYSDTATGNVDDDPRFLDNTFATGYRLDRNPNTSTCYDEGDDSTSNLYSTDFYGTTFIIDNDPDIGHEEVDPNATFLVDEDCGITLPIDGDGIISCYPVHDAVYYKYRFVNITDTTAATEFYNTNNNPQGQPIEEVDVFERNWAEAKATYEVEVAAVYIADPETRYAYNKICTITTPHITYLIDADCGATLSTNDGEIECYPVLQATDYQFRITEDDGTIRYYNDSNSAEPNMDLYARWWIEGGKEYEIEVQAKTDANNGNWYSYGKKCKVTTAETITPPSAANQNDLTVSVSDDELENSMLIYPNPASNRINFAISDGIEVNNISVYSKLGAKVLEVDMAIDNMDISSLSSGIYFMKINTNFGTVTKKIIKQ